MTAARRGEAFDVETGIPFSMQRAEREVGWLDFAMQYVDAKWSHLAPNSRRNTARALTSATLALVFSDRGRPENRELRRVLAGWAFNSRARANAKADETTARCMGWLARNTPHVVDLAQPRLVRAVLDALARKVDGEPAAAGTVLRQRGVLVNLAEFAVERKVLDSNPITALAWRAPRTVKVVDKRVVVNPDQARALVKAVRAQKPSGARLAAFFGSMYYSALRPGEAATLRRSNLLLPRTGWGELLIEFSTPSAGASWTDSGVHREQRQLKHRARGETRSVPCPPELTALLNEHLAQFGTNDDGLLFWGVRNGQLAESTYCRVWRKARTACLTTAEARSPLAARPYDLRHAAVSTWLNAGVPPTQVAEWAGHSVAVLLQIYAKCLAGQEEIARQRIATALRRAGA